MIPRSQSRLEWAKTISILEVASKLHLSIVANSARCWRKANHTHGDRSPSLGLDVAKNRYQCFVCDQRASSVVDLVMGVLVVSLPEALGWFQRHFEMPDHVRQGPRPADFDSRRVSLSTIIRSGLWASLTDPQRSILAVLWDGRDDEGTVAASYSRILRLSGLASRKTVAAVVRTFEQYRLVEVVRRNRAISTYRFLEDEIFLQLQREPKSLVPPAGPSLSPESIDKTSNLVPLEGTSSEECFTKNHETNLVPLGGTGSFSPLHTGLSSPRGNQISEFSARELQVLRLAARGFQLFPCRPHSKEPAGGNWRKLATADPKKLALWFATFPEANWAVATGPVSGFFVLDVDAEAAWSELCHRNGSDVESLGVRTSRGRHLYLRYPTGSVIRNSTSKIAPSIDVRGQGGYALCPPSIHPNGAPYEWLGSEDRSIAMPPAWALELIQQTSGNDGNGRTVPTTKPSAGPIPLVEELRLMPCYVHRRETPHWTRGEDRLCEVCHPSPAEVRV